MSIPLFAVVTLRRADPAAGVPAGTAWKTIKWKTKEDGSAGFRPFR